MPGLQWIFDATDFGAADFDAVDFGADFVFDPVTPG